MKIYWILPSASPADVITTRHATSSHFEIPAWPPPSKITIFTYNFLFQIDYPPELPPQPPQKPFQTRRSVDVEATLMPPPPVPPRPPRMPQPRMKVAPPAPPRGLPRSYMVEFPIDVPSTSFDTPMENFKSQVGIEITHFFTRKILFTNKFRSIWMDQRLTKTL